METCQLSRGRWSASEKTDATRADALEGERPREPWSMAQNLGHRVAKYLSKKAWAACLKGKRLWATFGEATWSRVKDIRFRSWLGQEYWRLRGDAGDITREQSYGIRQEALMSYARWVNGADGMELWRPPEALAMPEQALGVPC